MPLSPRIANSALQNPTPQPRSRIAIGCDASTRGGMKRASNSPPKHSSITIRRCSSKYAALPVSWADSPDHSGLLSQNARTPSMSAMGGVPGRCVAPGGRPPAAPRPVVHDGHHQIAQRRDAADHLARAHLLVVAQHERRLGEPRPDQLELDELFQRAGESQALELDEVVAVAADGLLDRLCPIGPEAARVLPQAFDRKE